MNKVVKWFENRKKEVGYSSLKHLVTNVEMHIKEGVLQPDKQMQKQLRKAGVKPENEVVVYNQVLGLVLGVQAIDEAYEKFQYDPDKSRKVFLPQKEMVQICGAHELDGRDSAVHQTIIAPSRKLIEFTFYKGKGLKLEGEVKNSAYYEECNPQNLSNFTAACKVVSGLKTLKLGENEYLVSPVTKAAAMAGIINQQTFITDSKKGLSK